MKNGWNEEKSLRLTQACTWVFLAGCIVLGAVALPGWKWFLRGCRPELAAYEKLFILSTYLALVPAIAALLALLRLLANLRRALVFVPENVALLRALSWLCAMAFVICAASALYYLPFAAVGAAAGLMALLLNAVKNCFGRAVQMKDELDYTV